MVDAIREAKHRTVSIMPKGTDLVRAGIARALSPQDATNYAASRWGKKAAPHASLKPLFLAS